MTEPQKGGNRQHLAGGGPWRWVFESLRAAMEPASLVPSLLLFAPNILHSCSELPPLEVAVDIALLVQSVSDKWLPIGSAEDARTIRMTCIFIKSVFQRVQLEFNADSLQVILQFLQGTITTASTIVLVEEKGGTEAGRAKAEAMAALGRFLLQVHNAGLLCMDDVSGHVLFLTGLITYPVTPVPAGQTMTRSESAAQPDRDSNAFEVEVQRLTFVAIGSLVNQARPLVSDETWNIIIQTLRAILESLASKNRLVEDYAASRYYVDLLRCVYIVVSEPVWYLKEHIAAFVKVLRMFFRYGVSASQQSEIEGQTNGESICMISDKAGSPSMSFSFDTSENASSDLPVEDEFCEKSSELRLYSVISIQAMARGDPEGVKNRSALLLLPGNNGVQQPRFEQATLLSVLLYDPVIKIRAAAAATLAVMLECPIYQYRQGADQRQHERIKGPSVSQRQMFVELQTGLVQVILNEKHNDTLLAALKALSLYVATAPFSQLPAKILSKVVISVNKRLQESSPSPIHSSVVTAAIACIKAALSTAPPSAPLEAALLSPEALTGSSSSSQPRSLLFDLIAHAQSPAPTTVQVEAILALKAAAQNYPVVVAIYWDEIFNVVARVVDLGVETQDGASDDGNLMSSTFAKSVSSSSGLAEAYGRSDDELIHTHAIGLLDELLRVASDSEGPVREERDDWPVKSPLALQLPVAPAEAPKRPLSPSLASLGDAKAKSEMGIGFEPSEEDVGCLQWLLALERLLPEVLRHTSPMVRGAAVSCFAGLTPAVFFSLPASKQEFILSAIMRASQYDETPAVRSAACRAVGVIVGFPQVSKRKDQVAAFMKILLPKREESLAPEHAAAGACSPTA